LGFDLTEVRSPPERFHFPAETSRSLSCSASKPALHLVGGFFPHFTGGCFFPKEALSSHQLGFVQTEVFPLPRCERRSPKFPVLLWMFELYAKHIPLTSAKTNLFA
jgi:hypothetical protein